MLNRWSKIVHYLKKNNNILEYYKFQTFIFQILCNNKIIFINLQLDDKKNNCNYIN